MEPNAPPEAGSHFEEPTGLLPRYLNGVTKDTSQRQSGTCENPKPGTGGLRAPPQNTSCRTTGLYVPHVVPASPQAPSAASKSSRHKSFHAPSLPSSKQNILPIPALPELLLSERGDRFCKLMTHVYLCVTLQNGS
jgi:hypothetical protein